jgi:hypothetical protein
MKTEIIVIDSRAYEQLKTDMGQVIRAEVTKLKDEILLVAQGGDEWLNPTEVRELLGIGRTKYFQMKAEGAFQFSQFGRKSKISRKSLEVFLKTNMNL